MRQFSKNTVTYTYSYTCKFMGACTYDEAKKEEDKIIKDLEADKTAEQCTGKLLTVTDENEDKLDSQSGKGEPKKEGAKKEKAEIINH